MSKSAKIIAPPYHVQSTAANLRNGFPYFTHHDSVSALWSQKWRVPCATGIYPFSEAKVEDFDPIFAELTKISVTIPKSCIDLTIMQAILPGCRATRLSSRGCVVNGKLRPSEGPVFTCGGRLPDRAIPD